MASTTIRTAARRRLVELLAGWPGLAGVQVTVTHPGDELKSESIWTGVPVGDINIPTMQAGRKERDDVFDVPLWFRVANRATEDDTLDRLDQMIGEVCDYFATDTELGGLDGVLSAELARQEGPDAAKTNEGAEGGAALTVSVHARLT